jgi:protoheme IX farnesyltransferase
VLAHRRLLPLAAAALVSFGAAAAVPAPPLHLVCASHALAATCALAAATFRGEAVPPGSLRDYLTLTKPRIMTLLLLTGACGMVVGARGLPSATRFGSMLLGLALACGGASALNHVLDRDIDRLMGPRTARRPVASGRMSAPRALEFGLVLSAASFTLLGATVNLAAALLALVGNLFYVLVYTGYLKRRGPANIVIGGAAGAVPPVVGYAAATGNLGLPALWLFLIVFLWTPPHFWALALLLKEQYAAADVPMLPVVVGDRETVRRILRYTLALVAFTTVPVLLGTLGLLYLGAALALGGLFLALALRLRREASRPGAVLLFHYSLLYLALLFVAAAVDVAV